MLQILDLFVPFFIGWKTSACSTMVGDGQMFNAVERIFFLKLIQQIINSIKTRASAKKTWLSGRSLDMKLDCMPFSLSQYRMTSVILIRYPILFFFQLSICFIRMITISISETATGNRLALVRIICELFYFFTFEFRNDFFFKGIANHFFRSHAKIFCNFTNFRTQVFTFFISAAFARDFPVESGKFIGFLNFSDKLHAHIRFLFLFRAIPPALLCHTSA